MTHFSCSSFTDSSRCRKEMAVLKIGPLLLLGESGTFQASKVVSSNTELTVRIKV